MQFYLASHSTDPAITRPLLDQLAEAYEFQLYSHLGPFWQGGGAKVTAVSDPSSIPDTDDVCPIIVFDDPDQPGALGWHTYDKIGREYGAIFWQPIKENGGTLTVGPDSLSVTGSHEVCEAYVDPYTNDVSFVTDTVVEWKEVGDRTQGDCYPVNNVACTNFLGPRAFRDGPGPYDWLRLLVDPWEVRPGGYVQRLDVSTGKFTTTWGKEMKKWKQELVQLKLDKKVSRLARRQERHHERTKKGA